MKALGKCPKCKKKLENHCRGCIESNTCICYHKGTGPELVIMKWDSLEDDSGQSMQIDDED